MHFRALILIVTLLTTGCELQVGVPVGSFDSAVSLENGESIEFIQQELEARQIDFEIYAHQGKDWLAYSHTDKKAVERVLNRSLPSIGPLNGRIGLCEQTEQAAQEKAKLLASHGIPTEIRESDGEYCWSWPSEYSERVAEIEPRFEGILARRESGKDDT